MWFKIDPTSAGTVVVWVLLRALMIVEAQICGFGEPSDKTVTIDEALRHLKRRFSLANPPVGYLGGRTQMRNTIADATGCSLLHAEAVVDQLHRQDRIRYEGDNFALETVPASWKILF
jgi:hypothetical protein